MTSLLLAVLIVLPDLIFHAYQAADRRGLDGDLIAAQISAESKWDPTAYNHISGARGLAQIISRYHPTCNAFDPYDSIDCLVEFNARTLAKYHGDWSLVLAAWNAGEPTVDYYGGVPPYAETRAYVREITKRAILNPVEIKMNLDRHVRTLTDSQ